jgi:hypothetical protein
MNIRKTRSKKEHELMDENDVFLGLADFEKLESPLSGSSSAAADNFFI